jgi:hypothetical protein
VSPLLAVLIVLLVAGAAVAPLLVVRRGAPVGGRISDTQRGAGIFAVVGTGTAVLLAFVILVAFQSYDRARQAGQVEAEATADLYDTAQLFPPARRDRVKADLICYGRAVIHDEWVTMRDGEESELVERWLRRLGGDFRSVARTAQGSSAVDHWFERDSVRADARADRLHESGSLVPGPVWVLLFVVCLTVLAFAMLFADRGERAAVQAVEVGAVADVQSTCLLLVAFLDDPYTGASGSIQPDAMETTLRRIDDVRVGAGAPPPVPCDREGAPARAAG